MGSVGANNYCPICFTGFPPTRERRELGAGMTNKTVRYHTQIHGMVGNPSGLIVLLDPRFHGDDERALLEQPKLLSGSPFPVCAGTSFVGTVGNPSGLIVLLDPRFHGDDEGGVGIQLNNICIYAVLIVNPLWLL